MILNHGKLYKKKILKAKKIFFIQDGKRGRGLYFLAGLWIQLIGQ
jgi:hypothetical protein